ncbi:MAG: hypothetical protein J0H69_17165 [Burkholderiales bacterium]|nr:hypothetical protein [Burkholderiales bacterium]
MTNDTYPPREAKKLIPGGELHLTMLMASDSLNLVVGEDRAALLRFAQRVWDAAIAADRAERGEVVAGWKLIGYTCEAGDCGRIHETAQPGYSDPVYVRTTATPPSHAGDEVLLRRALEAVDLMTLLYEGDLRELDADKAEDTRDTLAALRERLAKEG